MIDIRTEQRHTSSLKIAYELFSHATQVKLDPVATLPSIVRLDPVMLAALGPQRYIIADATSSGCAALSFATRLTA